MMTNCWSQNPSDRPEMADVHRKLQKLLSQFSLEDQNEAAQNAISKTEMKHPSFQEHNTVAVDKLSFAKFSSRYLKPIKADKKIQL